jgi:hypothetical protein
MKKSLFLYLMILAVQTATAQTIFENHRSEVYNYLYRMAQKGVIRFDDQIRPIPRAYIAACLDSLSLLEAKLSSIEKQELKFYQQEYSDLKTFDGTTPDQRILKKDRYGRWRAFSVRNKDQLLQIDPVITATTINGTGKSIRQTSTGLKFWGQAGKRWGYHFFFNDVNENGTGIDVKRNFTPETGIIQKDTTLTKSLNYTELRGVISYSWNNGAVSFGNDHLLWGYGENGRVILSDKAPAFPYLRLDYRPFSWLSFNYTHAWLNSKIVDSNRLLSTGNPVFGGQRRVLIPKYFATHSVTVRPLKGLDISVGESIVYSDRMDIGYLMPLNFFKVYDNIVNNSDIMAGSNGQLFFQISSRNHIPKTHLYGNFFIDEVRIGTLFDPVKRRNQSGYTIGASTTDLAISYLTATLEYSRITPFTYANLIPAQNYTHHSYNMGDWMGNNADRFLMALRYTPIPKLKTYLRYQIIRKGAPGSLAQQYFQQPQPGFLFDQQFNQKEWFGSVSYEWINNLTLLGTFNRRHTRYTINNTSVKENLITLGVHFGL